MTTAYNGMGLPKTLTSSIDGALVDQVNYNVNGQLTSMRFPPFAFGDVYRTQTYWPWQNGTNSNSNSRLNEIKVGTASGSSDLLYFQYGYDSYGNIGGMTEQYNGGTSATYSFYYDGKNRLTRAFDVFGTPSLEGQTYAYDGIGRLTSFEGATYTFDAAHTHAVDQVNGINYYDYDANGNMTSRYWGQPGNPQILTWNHENRLVRNVAGSFDESYRYDADGIRVKKTTPDSTTYYINPLYEVRVTTSGTSVRKYYYLGSQRITLRRDAELIYLHSDVLGSVALATNVNNGAVDSEQYYAYGRDRGPGTLPTDHSFTGQKKDATGLLYFNARYYDPDLGTFISPDTLVPDPTHVFDYNRYMYARGNPLKYTDPSGHCAVSEADPDASDCWRWVHTIYASWDHTDYWNRLFPEGKEHFMENVATQPIQASSFQYAFGQYQQSDDYKAWDVQRRQQQAQNHTGEQSGHPVDAVAVGASYNADVPVLGAFALTFGGGVEVLAHTDGVIAVFVYGGVGGSLGAGASTSLYTARVRNLPTAQDYKGGSMGGDVTMVPGIGFTAGQFNAPGEGAYGEKYGLALGANISAGGGYAEYSKPLIIYDSNTGQLQVNLSE